LIPYERTAQNVKNKGRPDPDRHQPACRRYIFDFHDMDSQLVCLQNNHSFPATGMQISIAGHYYDQLSKSFKYVYAIDTNSGLKGLMLSNKSSPFRYELQTGFPVIESEALTAL
jgi:hypothetical protein